MEASLRARVVGVEASKAEQELVEAAELHAQATAALAAAATSAPDDFKVRGFIGGKLKRLPFDVPQNENGR